MRALAAAVAALVVVSAAAAEVWRPSPRDTFQIQFAGTLDLSVDAQVYEVDYEVEAAVVSELHARGRRAVCYFNAGAWEEWRPDADAFPARVLGKPLAGWPGERWLDIRRLDALAPIMVARMKVCRDKGFDAVDPDNVNGYTNPSGFPLKARDQLRYNRWLAATAHRLGLGIALKNEGEQAKALEPAFDFAVVESCFTYRECDLYLPFVRARKAVFAIEYVLPPARFCTEARKLGIQALFKRRELGAYRVGCWR